MSHTFPPGLPDNVYSLRFYASGTGTANFADNQFIFHHPADAALPVEKQRVAWSNGMRIKATGGDLEFSFDGTNVHGKVRAGDTGVYYERHEGGIAVRGTGVTFEIEAW
jgi:hypothetical protein